jgi:hypothetical protein
LRGWGTWVILTSISIANTVGLTWTYNNTLHCSPYTVAELYQPIFKNARCNLKIIASIVDGVAEIKSQKFSVG